MRSYPPRMIWLLLSGLVCQVRQQAIEPLSPALWLHRLSKEYSIIVWLGPPIAWKSWNRISSLFCMFISCFLHSLFAFPQFISKKEKKRKSISLFIIIRHELCYPPVYNLLMKIIQRTIQEILTFISLFAFLWICVRKLSCVSLYMFHSIGSILIPMRVHRPIAITRILLTWMRQQSWIMILKD